ncbi:hypothetical protein RQP46_007775 [Phenoliferia psychrophenolica]
MEPAPTTWSATHPEAFARSAAVYRQGVLDRLPGASILPSTLLATLPLGSDVSKVPETCGLLTPEQIDITRKDATEILEDIAAGKLTSEAVVLAFGLRAAIAHQLDQLAVKGRITSMGFLSVHETSVPQASSALLCEILENAGAVFYCHTTLPQSIMHLECESFWGRTLNPFNTSLTPGGSSGGEGALVGMRGSPLGIGSDIGGSIRCPAGNCGLYGLRPTAQRVPNGGSKTYIPGRDSILGVIGPLAHSLRDVDLFMSVTLGAAASPWITDPAYLEMPWRLSPSVPAQPKKHCVGVMWTDGELNIERDAFRSAFATHWNSQNVDVVLCPLAPYPAPPHDTAKWWSYTSLWNLVDYPCIAFPSGATVDQKLDREVEEYTPLNADDKLVHDTYTPELYKNAPVSLQLVARRYRDESLMDALKLVEKIVAEST